MSSLPRFDVVVWVKKTDNFPALRDELLGLAVDEPYEFIDYEGIVDFHWRYDTLKEAERVAETLTALKERPEIILLRASSYDDPDASITFKDVR